MREGFSRQLAELERRIESALGAAATTLDALAADLSPPAAADASARLGDAARALRSQSKSVDVDMVTLTARQAPVAGDLRIVLAVLQIAHHGGLIANQFGLIAEQLDAIDGDLTGPRRTAVRLAEMAVLAGGQLRRSVEAFAARDLPAAARIEAEDDAIDRLNRAVFDAVNDLDAAPDRRERALRHVLIARSLERIGDNAVDIAEQAAFLVGRRRAAGCP